METRKQGATLFSAVLALVVVLVVVQLWLVAGALDALLGGNTDILVPAALASLGLFALNAGLLWYVTSFDRRLREGRPDE